MSKKTFSDKDIKNLAQNKYVKKVSSKAITLLMNLKSILLQKLIMESLQE